MSESAKDAWGEVGERFSSWGRRVVDRYQASGGDAAEAEGSERELQRVAKELVDEISRGVTAVGKTFRDDEANRELGAAVSAIGDAITATVNEVSAGIRSGGARSEGSEPQEPPDDPGERPDR